MKKIFALPIITAIVFASCNSAPKADEAKTEDVQDVAAAEGEAYKVDTTQSVNFIGTKPVGAHSGKFLVKEGEIFVKDGTGVSGGRLVFDINSLVITDADTTGTTKLKGHLLSADFLDAEKFPTATFEITAVEDYVADSTNALVLEGATNIIKGNLTLKDVTKNVSFPAIINVTPTSVSAKANFNIDRTQWNLTYGNDKSLGDKFIRPEVNINFEITAVK